jgi:ethanolamine utilization protein EutA (predicted chaperonin)
MIKNDSVIIYQYLVDEQNGDNCKLIKHDNKKLFFILNTDLKYFKVYELTQKTIITIFKITSNKYQKIFDYIDIYTINDYIDIFCDIEYKKIDLTNCKETKINKILEDNK